MTTAEDPRREEDGADFGRASSTRAPGGRTATAAVSETLEPDIGVRPYYVTRGRTRTDRPLGIEAIVQSTARGLAALDGLHFEQHAIVLACEHPASLAEVAARLRLPLGVARVLVADLAGTGLLQVHDAPARIEDDISLIQRLIHGVRAL